MISPITVKIGSSEIEPLILVRERDTDHILKCKPLLMDKNNVRVYDHPLSQIKMRSLAKNCRLKYDLMKKEEILEKLSVVFDAPGKNKEFRNVLASNLILSLGLDKPSNWENETNTIWEREAAFALWVFENSKDYIVEQNNPFGIRKAKAKLCYEKVCSAAAAALIAACSFALTSSRDSNYMLRILVNPRDGRDFEEDENDCSKLGNRVFYKGSEYFERISIIGAEVAVRNAKEWIRDLVQNQKVPTHFVGVSIDSEEIQSSVKDMEGAIIAKNPHMESGFVLPQQLHLTLFVLRCYEQDTIDKAKEVLNKAPEIARRIFANKFPEIRLSGLNEFRQSLVYIGIEKDEDHNTLQRFVRALCQEFRETLTRHTLLGNDTLEGLPHCTVFRAKGLYKGDRKKVPSSEFQGHNTTYFGRQSIKHLELSIIGSKSDKGYAHIHKVSLEYGDSVSGSYIPYTPNYYESYDHTYQPSTYEYAYRYNDYYGEDEEEQAMPQAYYQPQTTTFLQEKKISKSLIPQNIEVVSDSKNEKDASSSSPITLNPGAKPFVPTFAAKAKAKSLLFEVDNQNQVKVL